ncbi:MAG: CBS domain-containing protein, partial [Candidatus Electrothrix sp. AR4]|nr:CBS domain-containing protein [Candidatus Electrothrix sp. AR4]
MPKRSMDIREIIIPLDRCPLLYEGQTLDEAIALFAADTSGIPILLVLNRKDDLIGRLSRSDILLGLVPNLLDRDKMDKFLGKETPN